MQKLWFALLGFVIALLLPRPAWLQTAAKPPAVSGKAVDIKASEIQADAQKTGRGIVQMLRVVDINKSEYDVGFAVLHRTPKGDTIEEHSQITEIYHIISGNATFLTGGTIENPRVENPVNPRIGPGFGGTNIRNGVSRDVGPGDVIVIPPNTPHWFTNVKSDQIVYLSIRIDPHHVLSMPSDDAADAAAASR